MSAPAFAWALERGATLDLHPADRLVLIYLADMANGSRECWPGQETIVRFTGLALRTVRAAIHRLADQQLIRVYSSPGFATRYLILRPDTPANGAGGMDDNPGKKSHGNPGKSARGTPANGSGDPGKKSPPTPRPFARTPETFRPEPRQIVPPTLLIPKKETLERARAREASQQAEDFQNGEKGREEPAPTPATPPMAPVLGTTTGSASLYRPPGRSSDEFLDDPSPDDALPKAEGGVLVSDDPADAPVDPGQLSALIERMKRDMRARSYPPRAAVLDRGEQIDLCTEKPPVKAYHLPDAILRLHRQQLAERAAAMTGGDP